ncbi:MAG: tetratricopeptide repeat protein [Thermoleophilaceae bacterium]
MVFDVTEQEFPQRVLERSRAIPVVVDFWAEWCAPCRQLGPALERAANAREGRVELAKLDVDQAPRLSQAFRVQGIPAVKAFKDGRVAAEFTGAIPPAEVERFFDGLVPSDAELRAQAAIEAGDEQALRETLEATPTDATVAAALGRLLLARGDTDEALAVVEPFEHDFIAAGLAARARLALDGELEVGEPFAAWDRGDHAAALEQLQSILAAATDPDARDALRKAMIAIFTELGPESELAREHRRRLAAALN